MSVYKEGFYAIHTIGSAQRQVYPDAADFGAPTKRGDRLWNLAKQAVDMYLIEGTRKVERYATGRTCTAVIGLMNEGLERGEPGYGKELKFEIEFVSAKLKNYDGFLTVRELT